MVLKALIIKMSVKQKVEYTSFCKTYFNICKRYF